jgi:hypothetical protein
MARSWPGDAMLKPGPLRITKQGLEATGVKDVGVGAPTETSVSPAPENSRTPASKD